LSLVIAASKKWGFVTAFERQGITGYLPLQDQLPDIMTDPEGNVYDLMGNVTAGPKKGQRLASPPSYSAKTFAWEAFFDLSYFEGK
jgi:hypothetical protein